MDPDGPIPARIAAMDEPRIHFFKDWRAQSARDRMQVQLFGLYSVQITLICFSSLLLLQAKLHPEQLSEDEVVKKFAREGRLRVRQLKSIPDLDQRLLVSFSCDHIDSCFEHLSHFY